MTATAAALQNAQTPYQGVCNLQNLILVTFTVTPTGNYTGGGDLLNLVAGLGDLAMSNEYAPLWVDIRSAKPGGVSGFQYAFAPASSNPTLANGKFQVLCASGSGEPSAPFVDMGSQAYPAGVTGDTIIGVALLIRL